MNTALKAILLGIVQGLSEFFPVSSSGHLVLFSRLLDIRMDDELLFSICLHIGTLAAVIAFFRKDMIRLLGSLLGMIRDGLFNLTQAFHFRKYPEQAVYRKILSSSFRRLTVLLMLSCIPTMILGFWLEGLAEKASTNLLAPGMGFWVTGIVLMVVDKVAAGSMTPRELAYRRALLIGCAQGISVLPGISRSGVTICASLLCGMNRKLAVRYSFILSVPTMLGALIFECGVGYGGKGFSASTLGYGFLGAAAAGLVAYFTIRKMLKIVRMKQLSYFSYYCFAVGAAAMIGYYAGR